MIFTCTVLIKPVALLICLAVLCAVLLVGICTLSVLIARKRKSGNKTTQTAVNHTDNDTKTADCEISGINDDGASNEENAHNTLQNDGGADMINDSSDKRDGVEE